MIVIHRKTYSCSLSGEKRFFSEADAFESFPAGSGDPGKLRHSKHLWENAESEWRR